MNELNQVNATVRKKQIGRIVGVVLTVTSGLVLITDFMRQKGITLQIVKDI